MPRFFRGILSLASLAACLVSAIIYFSGRLSEQDFKLVFLLASAGWFVFATFWAKARKK